MILTLVGVSHGMLEDIAARSKGTGADIMVRPPGSSIIGFSGSNMPEKVVSVVRGTPHVTLATGSFMQSIGNLDSIAGIHLDEFNAMSGGFRYLSGGPFKADNDLIMDDVYARSKNVHVGDTVDLGLPWHVTGIVEPGKLSRMFAPIASLQDKYSAPQKVSVVWVKVDDPANIRTVMDDLKQRLDGYQVFSMSDYISLISVNNIPLLKRFIAVIIGLAVIVGFMFVFLSMYTAVLERTREIGILKALGASPGYILNILIREAIVLAIAGAIIGILMTYATRTLMNALRPHHDHDYCLRMVAVRRDHRAGRLAGGRALPRIQGRASGRD